MNSTPARTTQRELLLSPSAQFKKEAGKSVIAIAGFILVYFLLVVLSLALTALCFFGGFSLVVFKPAFYTIIIGGGVIGCGIMVFIFLIKFLFSSTKTDNSDSIEIKPQDQPLLFETIYALAKETGTPNPKKIFLSSDVNAAVFYNSSFWSMFFPIRKNLKIGLGLVNIVNVSELKAVIAHEFGHFSQRSMKLGSWVYQVNKIIHDMLFNNRGYADSINSLGSVHGIVALFMQLTVQVVKAIQWVLHQMFRVVNKSYLGLSRQMEFHADLVAASVCGSNNIINALKRSEFAEACFSSTLDVCNKAWKEKKVLNDFYTAHRTVVKHMAGVHQFNLVNGLPVINDEDDSRAGSRVNCNNQWASHPTLQERKAYLEPFELAADVDLTSAWSLFQDQEQLKDELTKQFYKSVPPSEIKGTVDLPQFEALFTQQLQQFSYPARFKEFYNSRAVTVFDPEGMVHTPFVLQPYDDIMTDEAALLPSCIQYLQQDIAVLQSIVNREVAVSSFDFDGKKYSRKQSAAILAQLESEKEEAQKKLEALDQTLFRYFYAVAPLAQAEALKEAYCHYFDLRRKADAFLEQVNAMMGLLAPVFQGTTMTIENIQSMISDLKENHEPLFKRELNNWLPHGAFDADIVVKEQVKKFISTRYEYFAGSSFFENELMDLNNVVQESWNSISNYVFSLFKSITQLQAGLLEAKKQGVITG